MFQPTGHDLPKKLLGLDFISHHTLREHHDNRHRSAMRFGFVESDILRKCFPSDEQIIWCKANGYVFCPSPTDDVDLFGVRSFTPSLFCRNKRRGGWVEGVGHDFSREKKLAALQWLMFSKKGLPWSSKLDYEEQLKSVTAPYYVPSVTELVYVIAMYRKINGVRLFLDTYIRTSTIDGEHDHVLVHHSDEHNISIPTGLLGAGKGPTSFSKEAYLTFNQAIDPSAFSVEGRFFCLFLLMVY